MRSRFLMTHLVASFYLNPNGQTETTLFGCRGEDHEDMGKVKIFKD